MTVDVLIIHLNKKLYLYHFEYSVKKDLKVKLKIVFCVVDFSPFFDLVNMYPKCPMSIRITDLIKVVDSYLIKK